MNRMHNPPHPGHAIKEGIEALGVSVTAFADHIGVSRNALSRVINEKAGVSPEMSMKISEAFGQGTSSIWFRMQNTYDYWQASQVKRKAVARLDWAGA